VNIWRIDKKSHSLNNYKTEGIMMKNQIVHAPKMNEQNNSNIDLDELIFKLKSSRLVHSIILFGSKARGTEKEKSDIDICVIPRPDVEITLKNRISLNNSVQENIDISKINDLEYERYKRLTREYHKHVMERVRARLR